MSLFFLLKLFYVSLIVILSLAFLTLLERKLLSIIGLRLGPNKVSFFGVMQPILDGLKISMKQTNILMNFSFSFYYLSSFFLLLSSLFLWMYIPMDPKIISFKMSLLLFFLILGFHTLSCMFSAWSTYSKFSVLASLRIVSQLISYEGVLYIILVFFIFLYSTFSFYYIFFSYCFIMFPILFFIWVLSVMAELSRSPFDFGESESELVSGFNVEYGSSFFSFIFMSEYANILFFSLLSSVMFFLKISFLFFFFFFFFFIWIRSVLPRYRFDSFMYLCWKFMIPFSTLYFCFFCFFCI